MKRAGLKEPLRAHKFATYMTAASVALSDLKNAFVCAAIHASAPLKVKSSTETETTSAALPCKNEDVVMETE